MVDISERSLEAMIVQALLAGGPDAVAEPAEILRERPIDYGEPWAAAPGGYRRRAPEEYGRENIDQTSRQLKEALEAGKTIIVTTLQKFRKDKVVIRQLEERLAAHESLADSIRANTVENARLTFESVVTDQFPDLANTNFEFYKRVTDDDAFARHFLNWLFERVKMNVKLEAGAWRC